VNRNSTASRKPFQDAINDPAEVYGTPERVLADPRLDREGKRAILKAWERDARALIRAADEAMTGGESDLLGRVLKALRAVSRDDRADNGTVTALGSPPGHKARGE
jgi:hypothetical protein